MIEYEKKNGREVLYIFFFYFLAVLISSFFFYDIFNLTADIYSSSFIKIGLNPYQFNSSIGIGYILLPYNTIVYDLFFSFNGNFLLTAYFLKLIGGLFTVIGAIIFIEILQEMNIKIRAIYIIAFLFNPFMFFINLVGPYTSIIPFVFFEGSILFLYRSKREKYHKNILQSFILLLLASFSYYFYFLFIPTFLYSIIRGKHFKDIIKSISPLLIISFLFLFMWSPSINLTSFVVGDLKNIQGSGSFQPLIPYSILNLFNQNRNYYNISSFVVIIFFMSFIIPILLYKKDIFYEIASFAIILVFAFLLMPNFISPDYMSILPILFLLSFLNIGKERWSNFFNLCIFISQIFILPEFYIFITRNGTNGAVGFYYWAYYILKIQNFNSFYDSMGGNTVWLLNLNIFLFLSFVCITLLILAELKNKHCEYQYTNNIKKFNLVPPKRVINNLKLILIFIISIIIILSGTVFISSNSINAKESLNNGLFMPAFYSNTTYPSNDFALCGNNTFTVDSNSNIVFNSDSQGVGFYRNLSDQSMLLKLNLNLFGETINSAAQVMKVLKTDNMQLYAESFLNKSLSYKLMETTNGNLTAFQYPCNLTGVSMAKLNGSEGLRYSINVSINSSIFEYFILNRTYSYNTLFTIYQNNTIIQLGLAGSNICFGVNNNNKWSYVKKTIPKYYRSTLGYIFLYFINNHEILGNINGANVLINDSNLKYGLANLHVGIPNNNSNYYDRIAISGKVSQLIQYKGIMKVQNDWVLKNQTNFRITKLQKNNSLSFFSNNTSEGIMINGINLTTNLSTHYLWIGQLTPSSYSFYINSTSVIIKSDVVSYYSIFILLISIIAPSSYLIIFLIRYKYGY